MPPESFEELNKPEFRLECAADYSGKQMQRLRGTGRHGQYSSDNAFHTLVTDNGYSFDEVFYIAEPDLGEQHLFVQVPLERHPGAEDLEALMEDWGVKSNSVGFGVNIGQTGFCEPAKLMETLQQAGLANNQNVQLYIPIEVESDM